MIDLLVRGGLWFTLPLTVIAFAVVVAAGWAGHALMTGRGTGAFGKRMVFHLGLFGLVLGLLGQAIALYEAMAAIEAMGSVSPALLAGGLRVSLIAPMYGLGIFHHRAAVLVGVAPGGEERCPAGDDSSDRGRARSGVVRCREPLVIVGGHHAHFPFTRPYLCVFSKH